MATNIGRPLDRVDGRAKVTGHARYAAEHPLPNVAGPFYHRLHVAQLRRQDELAPDPRLRAIAAERDRAAHAPLPFSFALSRKAAFRLVRPRWRRLRPHVLLTKPVV